MRLLALIWLLLIPHIQEEIDPWDSACVPAAAEVFIPIIGEEPYTAACDALTICLWETDYPQDQCEFPVYNALMEFCEDCSFESSFYMASLLIFEQPPIAIYIFETTDIQAAMPGILQNFQQGDYEAIMATYRQLMADYPYYPGNMIYHNFIIGLMYEKLGDLEAAKTAYRQSINYYRMPFVTYRLIQVLQELGYPDVAAAEALFIPEETSYIFPDALLESWMAYPVREYSAGEGGEFIADNLLLPGVPIQLAHLSDGSLMIFGNNFGEPIVFYPSGENTYSSNIILSEQSTTLTFIDDVGHMVIQQLYIMGNYDREIWLAPIDIPDPRLTLTNRCEDGARWGLEVDGYGMPRWVYEGSLQYYDAPDGAPVGDFWVELSRFHVVDGPICIGNIAWWEIDFMLDDGETYWLPEAELINAAWVYLAFPTHAP